MQARGALSTLGAIFVTIPSLAEIATEDRAPTDSEYAQYASTAVLLAGLLTTGGLAVGLSAIGVGLVIYSMYLDQKETGSSY